MKKYTAINVSSEGFNELNATHTRQASDMIVTIHESILQLIGVVGEQQLTLKEMLAGVNLKNRGNFTENYLNPAIKDGYVTMICPHSPRHPRQKYLLTEKGLVVYHSCKQ